MDGSEHKPAPDPNAPWSSLNLGIDPSTGPEVFKPEHIDDYVAAAAQTLRQVTRLTASVVAQSNATIDREIQRANALFGQSVGNLSALQTASMSRALGSLSEARQLSERVLAQAGQSAVRAVRQASGDSAAGPSGTAGAGGASDPGEDA